MRKTFRGQLEDGAVDRIYLAGDLPGDAYRIIKLQVMPKNFNTTDEYNLTIWKKAGKPPLTTFDFSDPDILGAAYFEQSSAATEAPTTGTVIFDDEIVNQDIYIGLKCQTGNPCNYYIELEQVKISTGEQAVVNFKAALLHTRD